MMQRKRTSADGDGGESTLRPVRAVVPTTQALPGLKDSLQYLLRRMRLALRADIATVLLFDDTLWRFRPIVSDGPTELEVGFLFPLGKSIAGQVANSPNGLIFHNAGDEPVISRASRGTVESVAGVPLRMGDRLLGVLCVASLATLTFKEHDLLILRLVGERAAAAIERERVLEAEGPPLTSTQRLSV